MRNFVDRENLTFFYILLITQDKCNTNIFLVIVSLNKFKEVTNVTVH